MKRPACQTLRVSNQGPWEADVLGEPYLCETIDLAPDTEGAVEANLVLLRADEPTGRAVLHVHGFADYFFHTAYAEWWTARGYDFYALDLRKFGRSIREHQTPNLVLDLGEYDEELDAAWQRITERDGHDRVVLSAHSTGGLVVPLWLARQDAPQATGLVLNSPWFDLHGPGILRHPVGKQVVQQLSVRQPLREISRNTTGVYGRSLHREHGGEWDYDLAWKPLTSWPITFGWLERDPARPRHAARRTRPRPADAGADIRPLGNGGDRRGRRRDDGTDIVLDVQQIRRWAPQVSRHLTLVSVEGAIHDVVLSSPQARERAYDELGRWEATYVSG